MALAFILLFLVAALCLLVLDLYRRSQHTRILQVPGGLRFEAQKFTVQINRQQQDMQVQCGWGLLTPPIGTTPQQAVQPGSVDHRFAAVGIAVEVRHCEQHKDGVPTPVRTGRFDIVIRDADGTQLTIARVNGAVAASFKYFYLQVRVWIDKLEKRLERERIERLRAEAVEEQARQHAALVAGLRADKPPHEALSEADCNAMAEAQIASWRQAAGFKGQHSAHHTDPRGEVLWFVDLAADGRITLHAHKQTLHASLLGARIVATMGEIEVGVRDAYWSEDNPDLRVFQVLKGHSVESRRAWKERLEILGNGLAVGSAA